MGRHVTGLSTRVVLKVFHYPRRKLFGAVLNQLAKRGGKHVALLPKVSANAALG
jgi:hypothetical protein